MYFLKAVTFSDHDFSKIKAVIFVDLVISHQKFGNFSTWLKVMQIH